MRNLKLVKDPHQHFAVFWKEKNPDGVARAAELQETLRDLVDQVKSDDFLARCATVELLPSPGDASQDGSGALASQENPTMGSAARKVPGTYWVVPGDLLEVALLACELVEQECANEQERHEQQARLRSEDTL